MTNVPTFYDIFDLFILPPILSFIIASLIHYSRFRDIRKGLITGLLSLNLLFLLIILLFGMSWTYLGILSGVLTGSVGLFTYPSSSKEKLIMPDIRHLSKKQMVSTIIVALLLISPVLYDQYSKNKLEFSISDPENDLRYAGYNNIIDTDKPGIDITGMSSRIEDGDVVLEMQLADNALTENAEYRFYVATQKKYLWSMTLDAKMTESNGQVLQSRIPLSMQEDREIFQVLAVASIYDETKDLDLHDSCGD